MVNVNGKESRAPFMVIRNRSPRESSRGRFPRIHLTHLRSRDVASWGSRQWERLSVCERQIDEWKF